MVLEPQLEFTASQVRALKEFFAEFFDDSPRSGEAKALGKETGAAFQQLVEQLTPLTAQASRYPFLNGLTPVLDKLKEVNGKPYAWYLSELPRQEEALFDMKERIIDPLRKFMGGPQRQIYDQATTFLKEHGPNLAYVEETVPSDPEAGGTPPAASLRALLADPECARGNRMQQVKVLLETLQTQVSERIEAELTRTRETVAALKARIEAMTEFGTLTGDQQEQILRPFAVFNESIARQPLIAVIRDTLRRFEENDYQRQLSLLTTWAQPKTYTKPTTDQATITIKDDGGVTPPPDPKPRPIKYVSSSTIKVPFAKAWLADETDVDRYLDSMRQALLEEIRKGKRIQV